MPLLVGWPTDAGDGSVSTEERWRKMAQLWAPSGVVDGYMGRLDPDLSGSTVTVAAGGAWIDGHYAEQLTSSSVAVTSNGLVVIRFTPADNTFELLYRSGATTPTQTDATWELPIAQMSGGAMTDLREFVSRGRVTTSTIDNEAVTAAKLSPGSVDAFIETGGNVAGSGVITLTGSFQQVVTSTFTKPALWGEYALTVEGSAILDATETGGITLRASAGGSNNGDERIIVAYPAAEVDVAVRAKFVGLTGATQECSVDVRRDTGAAAARAGMVSWFAHRTG
jgi:hypothetical protein